MTEQINGVSIPCTTEKDREMAQYIQSMLDNVNGRGDRFERQVNGIFRKLVENDDLLTWAYYTITDLMRELKAEQNGAAGPDTYNEAPPKSANLPF